MRKYDRIEADYTGSGRKGKPILFYRPQDTYGCFSNFSSHGIILPHPFTLEPTHYKTGEHRFQAMKAKSAKAHDKVQKCSTAARAKTLGGPAHMDLRDGWGDSYGDLCYYVMVEVVVAKADQHTGIAHLLGRTGDEMIYEDSPVDDIWGWRHGQSYTGKNLLGLAWMYARSLMFE